MKIHFLQSVARRLPHKNNEGGSLRPRRDWFTLLGVALVCLVGLSVWSYVSFLQVVRSAESSNTDAAALKGVVTPDDIKGIFEERAVRRDEYQNTREFIDPSSS